jgi:hypothetical protein
MRTLVLLIVTTFIAQMLIGAVPPNEGGTSDVSRQRQRRLDRMAIIRQRTTDQRRARQREQSQRQQRARDQLRQARAELTPEQLEDRQQQDRDRRAEMTPERLEFRQQQDRDRHSQARAELTPEQLEERQQQRRDQHRRTTAAESVRRNDTVNDSNETFSIDMLGRPTAAQLEGFEFDQDKSLSLFYENSHDHVADLIQNLDDAAPGDETQEFL